MYEELKQRVLEANQALPRLGLVLFTWGNVSEREGDVVAIKPSGVAYDALRAEDIVLTSLDGRVLEGRLRPSSDLDTHLELYRRFGGSGRVKGVTHTHSKWATSWAQAGGAPPPYGTTHADSFYGNVPCTRMLERREIERDYELNTGRVIAETFESLKLDPEAVPAVLVCGHGPFTWGAGAMDSVHNAAVLEQVCETALLSRQLARAMRDIDLAPIPKALLDKHYQRKHGKDAYYGQAAPDGAG